MSQTVLEEIAAERVRQNHKGFTPKHDAEEHADGDLALFASVLACPGAINAEIVPAKYHWTFEAANRHIDRRERLIMAAAVLVAEIERLDAAERPVGEESVEAEIPLDESVDPEEAAPSQATPKDLIADLAQAVGPDPHLWDWRVGVDAVWRNGKYERRVCIAVFGQGSEQMLYRLPLKAPPSEERMVQAEALIHHYFGDVQVLRGY